jgi:CelD/BcsL family acetyltransferase involved in cellulose biosynthesis
MPASPLFFLFFGDGHQVPERYVTNLVPLPFALGELRLFSADLSLSEYTTHFSDCDPRFEPNILADALKDGADGVLFRSHPIGKRLSRLSLSDGMLRYVPSAYRRFYITLQGTFDQYLANFSAKSRSTVRRKVRKFADFCGGSIDFRCYHRPTEIAEFLRLAKEISANSYQERLLSAGLPHDAAFVETAVQLAGLDRVRGYLLFHDQRPISYLFCPIRDGVLLYQHVGYDPAYAKWSPGTVLLYLVLERLYAEPGPRLFDFTEGESQQKEVFSTGSTSCADIYYLKRSLRNLIVVMAHFGLNVVTRSIVRALEMLHLEKPVKRLIRRSA